MIRHTSFKHGWFYHYRVHLDKLDNLISDQFKPLKEYLLEVFENCPDDYFSIGPRSSNLKFDMDIPLLNVEHEIMGLCRCGLEMEQYKTAHSKVQMFMLQYDKKSIAVEVPIWLYPDEFQEYQNFFDSQHPLTGHIDLLTIDNGKIWVWDFKPNADKEKYAHVQTYFYALMLSKRTGIPLENFMCGYFDENSTYIFEPLQVMTCSTG